MIGFNVADAVSVGAGVWLGVIVSVNDNNVGVAVVSDD